MILQRPMYIFNDTCFIKMVCKMIIWFLAKKKKDDYLVCELMCERRRVVIRWYVFNFDQNVTDMLYITMRCRLRY